MHMFLQFAVPGHKRWPAEILAVERTGEKHVADGVLSCFYLSRGLFQIS